MDVPLGVEKIALSRELGFLSLITVDNDWKASFLKSLLTSFLLGAVVVMELVNKGMFDNFVKFFFSGDAHIAKKLKHHVFFLFECGREEGSTRCFFSGGDNDCDRLESKVSSSAEE